MSLYFNYDYNFKICDTSNPCGLGGIWQKFGSDRSLDLTRQQYSGSAMHWKLLNNVINEVSAVLSLSKQLKDMRWRPWVSCLMWVFLWQWWDWSDAPKSKETTSLTQGFHHKTWAKWDVFILTLCKYAKSFIQKSFLDDLP